MTIGLGCWGLGSQSYGEVSESDSRDLIRVALDNGIEFFDTAPLYGQGLSEFRLGRYLPIDNAIKIATKVGIVSDSKKVLVKSLTPKSLKESVDASLRRLKRDRIYLLQLHSPELGFESPELISTLMELKSSGKIEKIGISLKNPKMLKQQQDILPWDAIQFNCSILDQRVKEFSKDIEKLRKNGVELIARTPLNFGFLGPKSPDIHNLTALHHLRNWPKAQLEYWRDLRHHALDICKTSEFSLLECALRFPIDSKLATIVIPGATNSRELKENIQAFQRPIPLDLVTKFQNCLQFLQEFDSPYKIQ